MDWFNYYGLIIMTIIMIPNIIYSIKNKNITKKNNKIIELFEQIGRYGCFILMIFNIPYTYINFYFNNALLFYLIINGILLFLYLIIWIICQNKYNLFKAYSLSIIPTLIFLISGILLGYFLLIVFSIVFGICHIYISISSSNSD